MVMVMAMVMVVLVTVVMRVVMTMVVAAVPSVGFEENWIINIVFDSDGE